MQQQGEVLCRREYNGNQLTRSIETDVDHNHRSTGKTAYTLSYDPGNAKLESIMYDGGGFMYSYDEDEPTQVAAAGTIKPVYNMQGRLIECGKLKINYNPSGTMKSYTQDNGWAIECLQYTYDEKDRLISVVTGYSPDLNTTYSYRDNGLIDKIRGAKVKYEFY